MKYDVELESDVHFVLEAWIGHHYNEVYWSMLMRNKKADDIMFGDVVSAYRYYRLHRNIFPGSSKTDRQIIWMYVEEFMRERRDIS